MKFFVKITILSIIEIAFLENSSSQFGGDQFVIDDSDKDLSQHHALFLSGFENVPPGNSELAQIPPLEQIPELLKVSNNYGRLCILYHLKTLNESVLSQLFQQASTLQSQRSTWAPTILAQFSLESNFSMQNNALQILEKFVMQTDQSWNFPINEGFYLVFSNPNSSLTEIWNIFEVYSLKNFTILQKVETESLPFLENAGNGSNFNYYTLLKKDARRSNFRKEVMVGVSMDVHGYELATDFENDNSTDKFVGGFEVSFYRYLMDALNFTEKALRGKSYVREGPGGTLTGMAVPINNRQADICISSTEFLEYRISGPDGIAYLLPTFKLGMKAYFKQPAASSIRDVFTSAFSPRLWASLLALWVIICLSMHLAYYIYFKDESYKELSSTDCLMSDEISIWVFGVMCQQGWHFTPKFIGTRIIFFFGWFTGFMTFIAYGAQLVSILSVEVIPIKSFEDLLRDHFFLYNDNHIPTTKYFVKGLQERGIIPTLAENLRNVDIEQTILKMVKTSSAMISISDSLFPILTTMGLSEEWICNTISEVGMGGRSVIMSMFVKRSSPTRSIFNTKILQMLERGVNHRLLQDYFLATSVQCLKTGSSGQNIPLSSRDVFTAYAILLSGFMLSLAIVLVEHVWRKVFRSKRMASKLANEFNPSQEPFTENIVLETKTSGNPQSTNIFDLYLTKRNDGRKKDGLGSWAKFRF